MRLLNESLWGARVGGIGPFYFGQQLTLYPSKLIPGGVQWYSANLRDTSLGSVIPLDLPDDQGVSSARTFLGVHLK